MPLAWRLGNREGLARRRCSLASTPLHTDLCWFAPSQLERANTKQLTCPSPVAADTYVLGARAQRRGSGGQCVLTSGAPGHWGGGSGDRAQSQWLLLSACSGTSRSHGSKPVPNKGGQSALG
ncbi:hypothetical protein EYF80_050617 [Liparis tanakae]|uniref:Uncharacterized protein n=1 Tax=Liparis tanakae TaxID=230148 RepID=A0A4Z2FDG8_9TELE|nr:hypothetical protein EYF80_050617 [Liparis tanakae]